MPNFSFRHSTHLNNNYLVKEGEYFITDIYTDLPQDTALYREIKRFGVNDRDLSLGSSTSSGKLPYNRYLTQYHIFRNDLYTEGKEQFSIKIYADAARSIEHGSSPLWTIGDDSRRTDAYTATPSVSTLNEGASVTTTVRAQDVNASIGMPLHWSICGPGITSADLSAGAMACSGVFGSDGSFSFSHTLSNDLVKEGEERLEISLFLDAERTRPLGKMPMR